jgi:hypothetical protein
MLEISQYPTSLYYRTIAILIACYWNKNRYENKWNRIRGTDMNPCTYVHLVFDKGTKAYDEQKTTSSTNVAGEIGYLPAEN